MAELVQTLHLSEVEEAFFISRRLSVINVTEDPTSAIFKAATLDVALWSEICGNIFQVLSLLKLELVILFLHVCLLLCECMLLCLVPVGELLA